MGSNKITIPRMQPSVISIIKKSGKSRDPLFLYCLALGVWLTILLSVRTLYAQFISDNVVIAVRLFALVVLLGAELRAKLYFDRGTIVEVIVFAVMLISVICSTMNTMFDCLAFIFVARHFDFRPIAKFCLVYFSIFLTFTMASSALGIIDNYVMETSERTRQYLGFRYALYPPQISFVITCLCVYLYGKTCKPTMYLILVLLNAGLYYLADARLSFYLAILLLVLSALARTRISKSLSFRPVVVLIVGAFVICAVFSVLLTLAYDPSVDWMKQLDASSLLGGRLRLGKEAIDTYGITFFGQRVDLIGNGLTSTGEWVRPGKYNYIDCLYVQLFVRYGVSFSVILLTLLTVTNFYAWRTDNVQLLMCQAVIALHCVIDDLSLWIFFNPFMILIGITLYRTVMNRHRNGCGDIIENRINNKRCNLELHRYAFFDGE